jgi:hypothetical protein
MTNLRDFLHERMPPRLDRDAWVDSLWRDQLADYLTQYIAEISSSTMSMSKVAECLLDNQ